MVSPNGRHHDDQGREFALVDGERIYIDRMRDFSPRAIPRPRSEIDGVLLPRPVEERPEPDPGRVTLSAPQIHEFEAPDSSTLPVLGREGLIMEGGTNLVYSYPKVGKTELLTALVTEWARADYRVFYLTEEPFGNWKRRLGVHKCWAPNLRMHYAWGYDVGAATRVLAEETFDVLVVDTLRYTVGYQEGEGDKDVSRVLVPLFRAAAGTTVVCSYHARKMPGDGGRDISGHHSLYGAFDRAVQLTPVDGKDTHRKMMASGRCMYDGDASLEYRQIEPGRFEALDAITVTEPKERVRYDLQCLDCGELFEARRRDAKFCSERCWASSKRKASKSLCVEKSASDVSEITDIPLEKMIISDIPDTLDLTDSEYL